MAKDIRIIPASGLIAFSGSNEQSTITVADDGKIALAGSGSTIFDIQGSQGQLFSVTDSLVGSLFSVNDISGIPILEVFDTDKVIMGTFGQNTLVVTGSLVGVGTDTPNRPLTIETNTTDVIGALKVKNAGTGDASMFFQVNASGNVWQLGIDNSDGDKFKIGQDNANADVGVGTKLTIDTTGKVGIGTTVPTQKLSVSGVISSDTNNNYYGAWLQGNTAAGSDNKLGLGTWYNNAGYVEFIQSGTPHRMKIYTSNTADHVTLQEDGGKVGIGTSSPGAKLHVAESSTSLTPNIRVTNDNSVNIEIGAVRSLAGTAPDTTYLTFDNALRFIGGYGTISEVARITEAGNVGIGTTLPSGSLHIKQANSSVQTKGYETSAFPDLDGSNAALLTLDGNYTSGQYRSRFVKVDRGGNLSMYYQETSGTAHDYSNKVRFGSNSHHPAVMQVFGPLEATNVIRISNASGAQKIVMGNRDSSGADNPSVIVAANGNLYFGGGDTWNPSGSISGGTPDYTMTLLDNGKVGIGDTSPADLFVIHKDNTSGQMATYRNNTGFFLHRTYADYNNAGTISEFQTRVGVDGTYGSIGMFTDHSFQIRTNNIARIAIQNSGNVGIGTTSPQALLQVGSITNSVYNLSTGNADIIAANKDITDIQMGTLNITSDSRRSSSPFNQGYGPSITFTQNGSGYVNGYEKVIGGIKTEIKNAVNLNFASIMQFYTHNNTALTPRMTIDGSSGYVGIGTETPSQKLTVAGAISSSGDFYVGPADTGGTIWFKRLSGQTARITAGSEMDLYTDNLVRFIESDNSTVRLVAGLNSGTLNVNTATEYNAAIKLFVNGASRFNGASTFVGDMDVEGTITAREFHTEFVNASVIYDSGSTKFGNSTDDTHDFTGSLSLLSNSGATGFTVARGSSLYAKINNDSSRQIFTYSTNLDFRNVNGTSRLYLSGSGNIGIGTNTPGYRLHVDAGAAMAARFQSTADAQIQLYSTNSWAGIQFVDSANNDHIWFNGGNETFAIGGGGSNVAGKKLHVHGGMTIGSSLASTAMSTNGLVVEGNIQSNAIPNATSDTDKYLVSDSGVIKYRNSSQLKADLDLQAAIHILPNTGGTAQWVKLGTLNLGQGGDSAFVKVVSNSGYNASTSQNFEVYIRFKTSNASSQDANGFYGDSSFYVTGINDSIAGGDVVWSGSTADNNYDLFINFATFTGGGSFYMVEAPAGAWTHSGAIGQTVSAVGSATTLVATERFDISSNVDIDGTLDVASSGFFGGNVGIGTITPDAPLTIHNSVDPEIRLGYSATQDHKINWDSAKLFIHADPDNANGTSALGLGVDGTTRLYINDSGNVGIGTTSPLTPLHVANSAPTDNIGMVYLENDYTSGGVYFPTLLAYNSASNHSYGTVAEFRTGGGGGTDRPSVLFSNDHSSHTWAVGQGAYGANDNFAIAYRNFHPDTGNGWGTPRFVIDTAGFVGIGTTAPQEELEVKAAGFSTVAVNTDRNTSGENIGSFAFYGHNNAATPENLLYSRIMSVMTDVSDGSENADIYFQQINDGTIYERFRVKSSGEVQLPAYGAGYLRTDADGNIIADVSTVEDTLQTVTTRGNTTNQKVIISNTYPLEFTAIGSSTYDKTVVYQGSNLFAFDLSRLTDSATDNAVNFSISARGGNYQPFFITGSTGYVGIGTASPIQPLDVVGTVKTSGNFQLPKTGFITFYGNNSADHSIGSRDWDGSATDDIRINSYHNVYINLDSNSNNNDGIFAIGRHGGGAGTIQDEVFRVQDTGEVGIGTTSPQRVLDVKLPNSSAIGASIAGQISVGNYQGLHFGYSESGNNLYRKSAIVFERTDLTSNNAQGKVHILNGPQAGSASATLADAKLTIAENGNVGIGTTAPAAKLQVVGGADVVNIEGSGSTANTSIFSIDGNNGRLFEVSDDLSDSLFSVNTIAGLPVLEVFADNRVVAGAYNQNDFVISGSRVGIGTATPAYKFDIRTSEYPAYFDSTGTDYILGLGRNNTSEWWFKAYTDGRFALHENGVGDQVTVKAGGNVGIGTTSPDAELEISKAGSPVFMLTNTSAAQSWIQYVGSNDDFILRDSTDSRTVFRVSGGGDTYFEGGNVGIGTASPSAGLHVSKSMGAAWAASIENHNASGHGLIIRAGGTSGTRYITQWKDAAGTERFHMDDTGEAYFQNAITTTNVLSSGYVGNNTSQTRDKFRVWSDGAYSIGMKNGYDYGHLGAGEYAMSFQMDATAGRGWWWGKSTQNDDQGVMALTNGGRLNVATSVSIGEGQTTTSPSTTPLYVEGSGSTILDVQGSQGQLFSVTDSLVGSLFSVNDISGIPILEVFDTDKVVAGTFGQNTLVVTGSLVGIGTDTPVRKLHVSTGNTDIAARFENTTSNGTVMELRTSGDGKTMYFQTDHIYVSSGHMHFGNDTGNLYLRPSTAGGVGIGTTTPQSKLHVNKNGNANGGTILMGPQGSGANKWSYLAGTHYDQATGTGNGVGSAGVAAIGVLSTETYNRVYVGGGPYEINPATEITFWTHTATTHNLGGTRRMAISANGTLTLDAYGAGFLKTNASGVVSVDTNTYLTSYTETDTLDSVTDRGRTTTNHISVGAVSGSANIDGFSQNNAQQGFWYQVGTYQYINPTIYYKYTKVAQLTGDTSIGALEYVCKKDSNYPGAVRGTVHVATYNGSSMSVQHDQHGGDGGVTPEVYIDNNRDVWLRMNGSAWNSHLRWRWIDSDSGITKYDGSGQTNSQPASSELIPPGESIRFGWNDVANATSYGSISKAKTLEVYEDIYVGDQIIHRGDTNTYMQFHAADQWRVVTGGTERLEVNNTQTTVQQKLIVNDYVGIGVTNPAAQLAVTGNINDNWAGRFENTNAGGFGALVVTAGTTANEKAFEVRKNTSDSVFLIKGDGTITFSNAFTFPTSDGSAGQVLQTNGSGTVSWATVSGGGGTADDVKTIATNTNANHYLTFVNSNNASATAETVYTTDGIYVNPSTDAIYATGNIISYASSDRRLKDNLTPIANATEKISKLTGYEFDWNDKQLDFEGHDVGIVAQEVEEVLPEVVTTRKDGYKAVKYEKMVALLIEGMKEQQAEIEALKEEVRKLKG